MAAARPANPAEHDKFYEEIFALVAGKENETYNQFLDTFPNLKDAAPDELLVELGLSEAPAALTGSSVPEAISAKDPLRMEWENAATADDLEVEEGNWDDFGAAPAEQEVLDENGVPILPLSRASSGFILDGPGNVRVDNFCDPDSEDAADVPVPAYVPSALDRRPATIPSGRASHSLIAHQEALDAGGAVSQPNSSSNPPLYPGAGSAIVTLEDQIRQMHLQRNSEAKADDSDEDEIEIIAPPAPGDAILHAAPDVLTGHADINTLPGVPEDEVNMHVTSSKVNGVVNGAAANGHQDDDQVGPDDPDVIHIDATAGGLQQSAAEEGVEFVAVEAFRLDPSFDYDNVTLTPKDWPPWVRRPE